jgi:head-tail adaptor
MSEFAGALRERVDIEQRGGNRDTLAGATGFYEYDGCTWASVVPITAAGLVAADSMSAMPRWRVVIRKREGIGPGTRLVWRKKFLAVRGVEIDPRVPAQLVLTCEEIR